MSTAAFTTVHTARTAIEADRMIIVLRGAGLHPVDLSMSAHFSLAGTDTSFPVQVCTEEYAAAKEFLDFFDRSIDAPR